MPPHIGAFIFGALVISALGEQHSLGTVSSISCNNSLCEVSAFVDASTTSTVPLRLDFYAPSVVRWWLAVDGNFSNNVSSGRLQAPQSPSVHTSDIHRERPMT